MTQPLTLFFWLAVLAAFLVNGWFLGADLLEWARSGEARRKVAAAALLAAAFVCGQVCFSGVSLRGGYDNDHDFQYLSSDFFKPAPAGSAFYGKEVSPLVLDGIGDAVSGYSLAAVPVKNRLLIFLAAVLLFACLRRCGLGVSASFFGFSVFYFNFLSALNGNTFSTTPGNLFFLCSALYAAASFDGGRRGYAGLIWALCGLFLVVAGRYELAVLPGLWLAVSLARPGGSLRGLLHNAGDRWRSAAALCGMAALCCAWLWLVVGPASYNGPTGGEILRPWVHFMSQLWENNLAIALRLPALAVPLATAAAFIFIFYRAMAAGDRRRPVYCALLAAWALYVSVIFSTQAEYPLHFMRHQLYFFIPFVFLAAFAWEAAWGAGFARLKWPVLVVLCAVYLSANKAAALSLEGELRSNDLEWGVLLKASREWPRGCGLAYGPLDARRSVLKKYFPLLVGGCSGAAPACVYKYVPVHCQVFSGPENGRPEGCLGPWLPSGISSGKPLAEVSFKHRFYTVFRDSETRFPVPVRAGFYPATGPADHVQLLNDEGLCLLQGGFPAGAAEKFRAALALDPSCADCKMNMAASLALGGGPGAFAELKKVLDSGPAGPRLPLLSAVYDAAAGDYAAALGKLRKISASSANGRYRTFSDSYRIAIELRGKESKGR